LDKDQDIFFNILDKHKGIIFKIAYSYCKDSIDRDDLVQEITLQLWLSRKKYDEQYKISTWIYRIALNTAISFYRKNKSRKEKTVSLNPIIENNIHSETTSPSDENIQLLNGFIRELKELDKALILLYLDGLSQKEIAGIMKVSPTNVSTKVSRIKKQLALKFKTIKS